MADGNSKPRVFVGLRETAGYYGSLVKGLRELGVDVSHVNVFRSGYYPCPPARGSWVVAFSNQLTQLFHVTQPRRIMRWPFAPVRWLQLLVLFVWAVLRHDVFIFAFGSTFLNLKELPLLKALGKKLIFVFNGSDSRPPYLSGLNVADPVVPLPLLTAISAETKARLAHIEEHADYCIDHALSGHFHEKPFVNYLKIGNAADLDIASSIAANATSAERKDEGASVRVLHAPSRPALKGSTQFRQMIERLKAAGKNIDYVELRNRPHREVLDELAKCDFVLDELYSDMSLAGLGTEAASFGKPALVGGYGREALQQACRGVPLPMDTYCSPKELEIVFERLIGDPGWRLECGEKARNFVADHWQPRLLAEKFLKLIRGEAPQDWMFDPRDITYFHGWGVSEDRLRQRLAEFIAFAGVGALHLTDKPELERAILAFAQSGKPMLAAAIVA